MDRCAWLVISVFCVIRLIIAAILPAMIDEAYGITVSRRWSLSYFDHPPVCFSLARIVAWLVGSENIFFLRLPFVFSGAVVGWLIYDITRLTYGRVAGFWAVAWYSIAPFFLLSAGHFVVPDGPLDLFLLLTFRLVLPDLLDPHGSLHMKRWLMAGGCFALALASKYLAILFGASALAFLICSPGHRHIFRSPVLWLTLLVALLGLVPTLLWNASHDWISIGFQAGRAGTKGMTLQVKNFLTVLLGQMVYVLPGTWLVIMCASLTKLFRPQKVADQLFAWFTIVPPFVFLVIAIISQRSLPHWSMSGFLFGFPLVGAWTEKMLPRFGYFIRTTWLVTAVTVVLLFFGFSLQSRCAFIPRLFSGLTSADVNWQFQEWSDLSVMWQRMQFPNTAVVSNWVTGAKVAHTLGPQVKVLPLSDPRHFQFLYPLKDITLEKQLFVQPAIRGQSNKSIAELRAFLASHNLQMIEPPTIIQQMAGDWQRFDIIIVPIGKK